MAYEKATDLSCDTVHKIGGMNTDTNKPNPTSLEGYYLGKRTVESQNGTSVIHVFQTKRGNEGVWGTSDLNSKLGGLKLGTMTKIEYGEKRKLAGGKTKHIYNVFFDRENTIEVANLPTGSQNEVRADTTDGPYDDIDDNADAAAMAELAAAEARAEKVRDMLSGKGKKVN